MPHEPVAEMIAPRLRRVPVAMDDLPARRTLTRTPIAELLAAPTPVDWLVQGLMERDSLAFLLGDPASGKSFLAVDLAACIATGTAWHGHTIHPSPVAFCAGEGRRGLARRFLAWAIARQVPLDRAPLELIAGLTLPDGLTDALLAVDDMREAYGQPPGLIVVDTVQRALAGDENSAADVTALIAALDTLRRACEGSTILAVHHTGHGDKSRSRGSSVFRASADTEFIAARDGRTVTIACSKSKDAEPPSPMAFALRTVELPEAWSRPDEPLATSAVLDPTSLPESAAPRVADRAAQALEVARRLYIDHAARLAAAGRADSRPRVALDDWRAACSFGHKSTFYRARDALLLKGLVRVEGQFLVGVSGCVGAEP